MPLRADRRAARSSCSCARSIGTRRKDVIRLIMTEGPRFPKLAEFYYREVIARVLAAMRALLRRAVERGELPDDALVRFPQLLVAPGLVAIIWSGLFDRFEPLDVARDDARASRYPVRRGEGGMNARPHRSCSALALLALAACTQAGDHGFQGWVEADLIFVAPDEAGRVETLVGARGRHGRDRRAAVHRRRRSAAGRRRDGARRTLTNAQQAFDRAQTLLKTGAGTQKALDDAEATLRTARGAAATRRRPGWRAASWRARSTGTVQQVYFRPGEMVPAGRPVVSLLPPGNLKVRFFVPEAMLPQIALGDAVDGPLRRLHGRSRRAGELHLAHGRVHAAGDLQPRGAHQARVPDRGAPEHAGRPARRPAGRRRASRSAGGEAMSAAPDIAIDVDGLTKIIRRPRGGARPVDAGEARHDLRLPRAERLRQDHDHPHAVRPAHARRRHAAPASATTSAPRPTRSSARSAT